MARDLIEENMMLRECLNQSEQIIEGLERELQTYKSKGNEKRGNRREN